MEFVFVVPREALFPDCYPQGFVPFGGDFPEDAFRRVVLEQGFFVEREVAERTPAWKQVIPYTLIARGDELLLSRRSKRGGEARLHDKLSIGVGGHINPEDLGDAKALRRDPIAQGTRRELDEELELEGGYSIRAVGILNDDSNPVGAVHVGLVQMLELEAGSTALIRETDVLEGTFVAHSRLVSLLAEGENFETWSAQLIRRLRDLLRAPFSKTTEFPARVGLS